jgi:peptidoglycan/xylan/chitin deacetylase (PgdA/CDA1 family)
MRTSAVNIAQRIGFLDTYASVKSKLSKSQALAMMYHRISPEKDEWPFETVSPNMFETQVRYFRQNYDILSVRNLVERVREGESPPKSTLAITIDDGYKDNYTYAYPILRKYSVPATIFLATGYIGTARLFWWIKAAYAVQHTALTRLDLGELGSHHLESTADRSRAAWVIAGRLCNFPEKTKSLLIDRLVDISRVDIPADLGAQFALSWEDVAEMSESGIDFGAHSVSHPVLTNMSREQARYEIRQSKQDIETRIGKRVDFFDYPNGYSDSEVARIVQETGFKGSFTCFPSWIGPRTNPDLLGRIEATEDFADVRLKLCGIWGDVRSILNGRR